MDKKETVFWSSDTHRGSIRRLRVNTADGITHDMGMWTDATEIKTGRREHDLPHESVEAAVKRLTEKYPGFCIVTEPDAVAGS
jgi:hypothetical protein